MFDVQVFVLVGCLKFGSAGTVWLDVSVLSKHLFEQLTSLAQQQLGQYSEFKPGLSIYSINDRRGSIQETSFKTAIIFANIFLHRYDTSLL